jgi:hypothetical protein
MPNRKRNWRRQILAGTVLAAASAVMVPGTGQAAATPSLALAVSDIKWLNAVACDPSGALCMAAGVRHGANAVTAGNPVVSLVTPYGPGTPLASKLASGTGVYVHGIACISATTCMAAGETNDYSGGSTAELEKLTRQANGSVTGAGKAYFPAPGTGQPILTTLSALACPATSECVALGSDGSANYLFTFDPGGGGVSYTKAPAAFGNLTAVTCWSVTECLAGGSAVNADSLVMTFNASTHAVGHPSPVSGYLRGLACYNSTHCEAVSEVTSPSLAGAITAVNAGTGATGAAATIPGGGSYSAIDCAPFNGCLAVGGVASDVTSPSSAVAVPVVKGVIGTPKTLKPAEVSDYLLAVTCPGFNSCIGVGTTARHGGPGYDSDGLAIALDRFGSNAGFSSPNSDGSACPANGVADKGIGSNFQGAIVQQTVAYGGIYATIGAAPDCRDSLDSSLYTSTWVMLLPVGSPDHFIQAGIAYHQAGGPDKPFVELSSSLGWQGTNWTPPASDGISVGPGASSIEFPKWNGTSGGTFTILDRGNTGTTRWCSWVPQDVRSHPELEGSPPGFLGSASEFEMEMNGSCLWYFYMPTDHPALTQADIAAEVHTLWEHVPGSQASPLVFSDVHVYYSGGWHAFGAGSPAYACNTDASAPLGTGASYTFSAWATMARDNALNPACVNQK